MNPVLGMGRLLKGWIVNSREKLVLGLTVVIVVVDVLELSAAIQDARAARREYLVGLVFNDFMVFVRT